MNERQMQRLCVFTDRLSEQFALYGSNPPPIKEQHRTAVIKFFEWKNEGRFMNMPQWYINFVDKYFKWMVK